MMRKSIVMVKRMHRKFVMHIVLLGGIVGLMLAPRLNGDDGAPSAAAAPPAAAPPPTTETAAGAAPAEATTASTPPAPPLPIDQQPYRVLVALGVSTEPAGDDRYPHAVVEGLKSRIATRIGPLWSADVELAPWLTPGQESVLATFSESTLNARFLTSAYDKVFLATLEADAAQIRTSALEWDKSSQTATAMTSRLGYEPRVAVDRLFAELLSHFRPIASIEATAEDGNSAELRLRGGELIPPDAQLRPLAAGMFLRPYYRHLDRKKELRQLQTIPWSYLQVTAVDRGRLQAEIKSSFKGVLTASRRRTELMAIAVKPRFEATSVRIYPRGQKDNPLSGTRVDILNRPPTKEDAVADRLTLYTNRFGEAPVPAVSDHPLQYVYVMSGKNVLATVPFIPGDQPRVELEVPDDSPRLAVEGEVEILEAELIETVARREVLIARALGHARAAEWEPAERLVSELKDLATREALQARLERIRLPAVAAAKAAKNRSAESRINAMCSKLAEQIALHLDPDRVATFLTEFGELKQAM